MAGTILDGYISRGWIKENDKVIKSHDKTCGGVKELSQIEQRLRWYKLQKYLSIPGYTGNNIDGISKKNGVQIDDSDC